MRLVLDVRTQELLSKVYPKLADKIDSVLNTMWKETDMIMRVTDGMRTIREQTGLYSIGRSKPGSIVTWAKPGFSYHNYGLAVDCCFRSRDPYLDLMDKRQSERLWHKFGEIGKQHGLNWGGDFVDSRGYKISDKPHLEMRDFGTPKELLSRFTDNPEIDFFKLFDEMSPVV